MDVFLIIIAIICAVLAIIGSYVPAVPGPVLGYGALWIAQATSYCNFSKTYLAVMTLATIVVFALDYFLPSLITKKMGASNAASWGAFIGSIVGMFLTPVGIILGMLLGAFIGEYCFADGNHVKSIKAAIGAFLGFLAGTGVKLILCSWILFDIIRQLYNYIDAV